MEKIKLEQNSKVKRNKNVIFKEVDGVVFILDPQKSIVRTLNETASFVWQSLSKSQSIKKLTQLLSENFRVEEKKASADLKRFVLQYLKEGLFTLSKK
ncbi:MAG: PqqD family protein [Candidatus Marinimicrobia bacterium]|nr:PqqD family protein [Candidatus Neomarinimicrobiota bacterium]